MTITPLAPSPVPASSASSAGTEATSAAPGDFLAVLDQVLAATASGCPTPTDAAPGGVPGAAAEPVPTAVPGTSPNSDQAADQATPDETDDPTRVSDAAAELNAAQLAATAIAGTPVVPVNTATPASTAAKGAARDPEAAPLHPTSTGPAAAAGEHPAAQATLRSANSGSTSGDQDRPNQDQRNANAAVPATPAVPAGRDTVPAVPAVPSVPAPAGPTAPVGATAPVPASAPSTQLDRVSAQVFPEVTGLVSKGNGTHRIALTLNPEQLGEVRVVMTMRAGSVHVRLAAGEEARLSLSQGSAELSRMLEHAGATETRIVVRELPATPAATATPLPTTGTSDALLSSGGDQSQNQHAGTRADHPATDGTNHSRQQSTQLPTEVRPIQPVLDPRNPGVDLTM